jgi:Lipocalin-like domain
MTTLKRSVFLLLLGGLFLHGPVSAQQKTDAPARQQLIGAWKLVSVETIRPNGEIIYPFYGKHPQGLIIYDGSGWMSVQIVSDPAPAVPKADSRDAFRTAPAEERAAAADGYYAYCGTWTIDAAASTVTHHVQQSLYPGERSADFLRHFTISGDRLTLVVKTHEMGEDHERKLVWERVPSQLP